MFLGSSSLLIHLNVLFCAENFVYVSSVFFVVPPALAAFPQTESIDVEKLEPQFRKLQNEKGEKITTLFYNKGL